MNAERDRLTHDRAGWLAWGPYLSERQWGTVREDYSHDGDAWSHFPHDDARRRAYRWGEDGIGGFSDSEQLLCLSVGMWNGVDPILKERLFGLTNAQGNHGEDVKELYYYLDATPSHSYLKMLYKYPQAVFPYEQLVNENGRRNKLEPEFELIDSGLFESNRYFDVFVEYAQSTPGDILMRVTAVNRGPDPARIVLLPQIWFRNTWSWVPDSPRPMLAVAEPTDQGDAILQIAHPSFDEFVAAFDHPDKLLFCNNETRHRSQSSYHGAYKDAFHEYVVNNKQDAVTSSKRGTKAAGLWDFELSPGEERSVRFRLSDSSAAQAGFTNFRRSLPPTHHRS